MVRFRPLGYQRYRNVLKESLRQWSFASGYDDDPSHCFFHSFFLSLYSVSSFSFWQISRRHSDTQEKKKREEKEARLDKQMTDNDQPARAHKISSCLLIYLHLPSSRVWHRLRQSRPQPMCSLLVCIHCRPARKATAITTLRESPTYVRSSAARLPCTIVV